MRPASWERGHVARCRRHLADGSYSSVSNWIAIPFSMLSGNMPDRAGNMPALPGDSRTHTGRFKLQFA